MPTEIDNLQIEINANAKKANDAIDTLVGKLDILTTSLGRIDGSKLTGLANGVSRLAVGMQGFKGIGEKKFSNLADNINKLGSIDSTAILKAGTAMQGMAKSLNGLGNISQNAVQISEVAANISKLGGVKVTTAIKNLPDLTEQLSKFMKVMANSPQVSRNIIDMTNALANLAGQGRNIGAATNTLTNGLNKSNKAITKTSKSTLSLASAFGRFYASYFLVIRGIKGLWGSIEKTADYFESLNYFNVAFDKIAGEWSQDFEKYGYENAEAYAESFTDQMEDTFSKLSGIEFDIESGLLSETGTKNLGMNIQQITQYASQLASVTNSLKFTGEASIATSQALTKLAGDISSLFNIDYEQVSANFTSGLLGQSKALYKYGIDITQATLQTYAYELGLSKAVSEMTQGEKAQLRLLAILDQSKIAWGDQANTINSLANQVRVLENSWSETSMVFGQLFVPLLEDALPVINGVVIALRRLLIEVAGFMGVEIDPDKMNTGLNQNEDVLDGITDGFGDATAAAKEYENQLLGFDEVTKLQDTTATVGVSADGSGIDLTDEILDATSEYEKVWNEAYANMENRAEEWADNISKYLAPIEDLFKDISVGDWFEVGEDVSDLATGIFDFFSDALDSVDWDDIGEDIGDFLAGIDWFDVVVSALKFKVNIVEAIAEAWFGSLKEAPLETLLLTTLGAMKFTKVGQQFSEKLTSSLTSGLTTTWNSLKAGWTSLGGIKGVLNTDFATLAGAGSWNEIGVVIGTGIIAGISTAIAGWNFGQWLYEQFTGEEIDMSFGEQMQYLGEAFGFIEAKVEIIGPSEETLALTQNIKDLISLSKSNEQIALDNIITGDVSKIEVLADKYFEIADSSSRSAEQNLLLKGYAQELLDLVPELAPYINAQTGEYEGQRKKLEEIIDLQKQRMLQEIASERQKEALREIVDLEYEQSKIQQQYEDSVISLADKEARHEEKMNFLSSMKAQYESDIADKRKEQAAYDIGTAEYEMLEEEIANLTETYEKYEEEIKTANIEYQNSIANENEIIQKYKESEQRISDLTKEYDAYSLAVQSGASSVEAFIWTTKGIPAHKQIQIAVNSAEGENALERLRNGIDMVYSKEVEITVLADKAISTAESFSSFLGKLQLPTLQIDTEINTTVNSTALDSAKEKLASLTTAFGNVFSTLGIQTFATGGLVDAGQVFIAREKGPELVGSMGNSTAVANNFQIVEGIKQGVYDAVISAMGSNGSSQGEDIVVQIDGKQVFKAVQKQANNYTAQTGQSAFNY